MVFEIRTFLNEKVTKVQNGIRYSGSPCNMAVVVRFCTFGIEDAEHYFFKCTRFHAERIILFQNTRHMHPLNVNKVLCGLDTQTDEENTYLFKEVHNFIKRTKRF